MNNPPHSPSFFDWGLSKQYAYISPTFQGLCKIDIGSTPFHKTSHSQFIISYLNIFVNVIEKEKDPSEEASRPYSLSNQKKKILVEKKLKPFCRNLNLSTRG